MKDAAFVGVSLDSTLFSRDWVRKAICYILSQHVSLELVLGDRLLSFNKSVRLNVTGNVAIALAYAEARIAKRTNDIHQFLESEVSRLTEHERSRVHISRWDDYSDAMFVNIARVLTMAYSCAPQFQECVDRDVESHLLGQIESSLPQEIHKRLCSLYVIEETAMIIRITECGNPYEYYPQDHIYTLTELYDDAFADLGLSVEALVGHPRTRHFTPLPLSDARLHPHDGIAAPLFGQVRT
jgi:hypothetical protein